MIHGQRGVGAGRAVLRAATAFVVVGIIHAGLAVAAERPARKRTPDRSLRSPTNIQAAPIDGSAMRMRV